MKDDIKYNPYPARLISVYPHAISIDGENGLQNWFEKKIEIPKPNYERLSAIVNICSTNIKDTSDKPIIWEGIFDHETGVFSNNDYSQWYLIGRCRQRNFKLSGKWIYDINVQVLWYTPI